MTEAILDVFFGLVGAVVGLLPTDGPPGWLDGGAGYLGTLVGYASGLGAWIPFTLAGTVITALIICVAVGFLIKVVRIVASFFTAGGGSAA